MSYYFSKVLVLGFDAAVAAVSQKLKDEGSASSLKSTVKNAQEQD